MIIQDRATQWIKAFPQKNHTTEACKEAFQRFWGPQFKPQYVYSDGAAEYDKALTELDVLHDHCTPHKSETNAVAERAIQRVKEGTAATLLQSGLHDVWWDLAMQCYCFLRCVVDQLKGGETAWQRRFGAPFPGAIIPFGAAVMYKPSSPEDMANCHELGTKVLPGTL